MKKLTFKLVLPLTVIVFFAFTRWICAEVVDAPNSVLQGFPLPYDCPTWASSLALQFFVVEFLFDFFTYLIILFTITYLVNRFAFQIRPHKILTIALYIIAAGILSFQILLYSIDTTFYLHRSFDIRVIGSKFGFFWERHPDCF